MSKNPIGDPGHGDSPAAWTAVIVMLVGIASATVFFFLANAPLFWVSIAVVIAGPIVGWAMSKAGYGVKGPKYTPKAHD